ncbi:hypothetical protein EUX98_g5514 [Antrodiella citrinella]|uniref:Ribosomal RNA-processing protein 41 n=1 Tax=Antrodiella citrinella TaxID=2447956 RepID=A0A4S4MT74_9APHY|nr:hypothetical protein EUX98_g5514 [Antrodiella citrinella]
MTIDLTPRGTADGSAVITHGLTEVMVDVFGPKEAKLRGQTSHDRALVTVEVGIMPFSTGERRKRNRGDKRILELAATIKQTFEPVIQTALYPRSEISIFVHILQQDGGLLPASINATTLALITAGIPLTDYVTAITCGVYSTNPLLDLNTIEENDIPHLTVASLPRTGKVTLVAMETRLHVERTAVLGIYVRRLIRAAADPTDVTIQEDALTDVIKHRLNIASLLFLWTVATATGDFDNPDVSVRKGP